MAGATAEVDQLDQLAPSLSEEEGSEIVGGGGQGSAKQKRAAPISPSSRQTRNSKGYKFNPDQQTLTNDFDFASQSKAGPPNHSTSSSSEEGENEDLEEFEVLSPEAAEFSNGNGSGVPTTPTKVIPHKRTAENNGDANNEGGGINGTSNGSPPSSPAPKKRKNWEDYVAEDNAKRGGSSSPLKQAAKRLSSYKTLILAILVALVAVGLAFGAFVYSERPLGTQQAAPTLQQSSPPKYSWKKVGAAYFKAIQGMEKEFPNQNRETWIQLIASIGSTLSQTEPEHPSCITVLIPPSTTPAFSTCFLQKLSSILNIAVAPVLQNVASPKSAVPTLSPFTLSPSTFLQKGSSITSIRADLERYLKSKGKAVVALDIDKFTSEQDLLTFHGLCDNFKAVDKRATVLFPVVVPPQISPKKYEWSHARAGDISSDLLNSAFRKVVGADTGPALVARITDAVILLNEGDECTN